MDVLDIAVLVATVATAIFTGWAVWQRWRYTPRPLWIAVGNPQSDEFTQSGSDGMARLVWRVDNRGDAAAHDVRVFIEGTSGQFIELPFFGEAIVEPGEHVTASADVTIVSGSLEYVSETFQYVDTRVYGAVPPRVELRWRQHPNLRRVKRQRVSLPSPSSV